MQWEMPQDANGGCEMSAVCMLAGVSFFYFLSSVVTRTVSVFVIDVLISFYLFMFI